MNPPNPKPRRLALCIAAALVALAGTASAQAPAAAGPSAPAAARGLLSLREAAQLAVQNNPEVLARWHSMRAAEAERDVARGALLPRVDLAVGVGSERRDDIAANGRTIASLSLSQLLYDGFATRNEIRRLDHASRVRLFEFIDASESAAFEASRAYVDVLRYRELLKLAEDNFVEHRTVFGQTERRVNARIARAVDLEQVTGRLALAEANLLTETANLHDTTARFQRVVGRLPSAEMALPSLMAREIPESAGEAVGLAQVRNAALLASIENVRASKAALESRKGVYQPRFDFRVRRDQSNNLPAAFGATDRHSVAEIVLSWNLFSGFSDVARERQFAEQLNVAMDVRDKTCRDIKQTLLIAHNDIRKLSEQMAHLQLHEAAVGRALLAYRQQFDIGQRSLLDLLDTENELFQARRAVVNARFDLNLAYARTQASLGNLLRTLELTNLDPGELAAVLQQWGPGEDGASQCPVDPVTVPAVSREALMQRVADRAAARPALPAAQTPAAAGLPAAPAAVTAAPAPGPAAAASAPAARAAAPAAAPAAASAAPQATVNAVRSALEVWRRAWAERNVAAYLQSYGPQFVPADGASRRAWESRRRAIIGAADGVALSLSDIVVTVQGPDRATTAFRQAYRSASYQDTVAKTLEWQLVGGEWRIVRETAAPAR